MLRSECKAADWATFCHRVVSGMAFDTELSKPELQSVRLRALHIQRVSEISAEAAAAAKEAAAAARRETAAVTCAVQAEADLQRQSVHLLTVQGHLSIRGAFDYIEEDLRSNHPRYLRLTLAQSHC